jgi:hypothetical protein
LDGTGSLNQYHLDSVNAQGLDEGGRLREDSLSPSTVYRAAARHAMTMLKA